MSLSDIRQVLERAPCRLLVMMTVLTDVDLAPAHAPRVRLSPSCLASNLGSRDLQTPAPAEQVAGASQP